MLVDFLEPQIACLLERLAHALHREVDDRRRATERGRARASLEVVGRERTAAEGTAIAKSLLGIDLAKLMGELAGRRENRTKD